jgi:hypothetical protein
VLNSEAWQSRVKGLIVIARLTSISNPSTNPSGGGCEGQHREWWLARIDEVKSLLTANIRRQPTAWHALSKWAPKPWMAWWNRLKLRQTTLGGHSESNGNQPVLLQAGLIFKSSVATSSIAALDLPHRKSRPRPDSDKLKKTGGT